MPCHSRSRPAGGRQRRGDTPPSSAGRRLAGYPRPARLGLGECGRPTASTAAACAASTTVGATAPNATRTRRRARRPSSPWRSPGPGACPPCATTAGRRAAESRSPRSARRAGGRSADSRCRSPMNGTCARRPRCAGPAGIGGGQHRQRVAGWRGVGDVAAERAAILDLRAADLGGRGDQHRHPGLHQARGADLGVGGQRADAEPPPAAQCRAARRGPRGRGTRVVHGVPNCRPT